MWNLDVLEISSSLLELRRLILSSTRLLQLRQRANVSELRAFVFSQDNMAKLKADPEPGLSFRIVPKNSARGLKGYVRPMSDNPDGSRLWACEYGVPEGA